MQMQIKTTGIRIGNKNGKSTMQIIAERVVKDPIIIAPMAGSSKAMMQHRVSAATTQIPRDHPAAVATTVSPNSGIKKKCHPNRMAIKRSRKMMMVFEVLFG